HAIDHFVLRHDFLAGTMAAALLPDLVFHVHGGHADVDEGADRARDVERAAPTGIDVDQQGHLGGVDDAARIDQHVFHRADAQVRHAERIGGDAAAGQI